MRSPQSRGLALGTVLTVIGLALMAALLLAGVSVFHLSFMAHASALQSARNRAESALAETLYQVMDTPTYGQHKETRWTGQGTRSEAIVTFDPDKATEGKVMCSLNNLPRSSYEAPPPATAWPTGPLPYGLEQPYGVGSDSTLIAARATVDGVTARAVAIVTFPPYRYALASSGPFSSSGPLMVASSDPAPPAQALANARGKGSIASNSTDAKAIVLEAGAEVRGNAISSGGIKLDPRARVLGAVEQFGRGVGLPTIDVPSLDPVRQGMPDVSNVPPTMDGPRLSGFNRADGNVVINGNFNIEDGVLFVPGNLTVRGGITGHGVVIVTGDTTIDGGGDMTGDNLAAVVSGGDVTITGRRRDGASFAGLVAAGGNFTAKNMTLVGAFVGNGPNSKVELQDVNLIHVPQYSRLDLNVVTRRVGPRYPDSPIPAYIGPNLIPMNWLRYTVNGEDVYALTDTPEQDPLPKRQFWDHLARYLRRKGLTNFDYSPGWWDRHTLRSNSTGEWYPVDTFLGYLHSMGSPPPMPKPPGEDTIISHNGRYCFDMNRFVSPAERMHVLLWRVE